jgi:DNA polymerase III epsilon subunit family exonuclease
MGLLNWLRQRRRRRAAPLPPVKTPPAVSPAGPVSVHSGFVVVDVETTGLAAARDRIVEIAIVRTDAAGGILDEWATLINPGGPVGATKIHGITAADVRTAPRFSDIVGELTARLAGRAVVAHNARFDLAFIRTEYARAGWDLPAAPYLCTLDASSTYLPHLSRRRLADCCWACGIQLHDTHSALGDARATANLLASFLDSNFGRPPTAEHVSLPALAARIAWPAVPRLPVETTRRGASAEVELPAPTGTLWVLLDNLPLSTAMEEGAPAIATAYLEMLFEVLEDGVLTDVEAQSLAEVAKVYSLTRQQVEATHRGFLLALAHRIVEDGKVTREERNELLGAAKALGFSDELPGDVLDHALAALNESRGTDCEPLSVDWPHGEPLRVGQGVAFTGCDQLIRAQLEGRAQRAGLRVTGAVTRKTAVLVTDGADPNTTKAASAREHGTRVVTRAA